MTLKAKRKRKGKRIGWTVVFRILGTIADMEMGDIKFRGYSFT